MQKPQVIHFGYTMTISSLFRNSNNQEMFMESVQKCARQSVGIRHDAGRKRCRRTPTVDDGLRNGLSPAYEAIFPHLNGCCDFR